MPERTLTERPFFPVEPFGHPDPEQRAAMRGIVDRIGLHLICARGACRRGGRCRDPDPAQMPHCFWAHRGTVRFLIATLGMPGGGQPAGLALAPDAPGEDEPPAPDRPPPPEETVLGAMRAAGIDIAVLARAQADGADEWDWETNPAARRVVEQMRAEPG